MKNTKEYKISIAMFIVAIVCMGVALVTGLIQGLNFAIDSICAGLGLASMGLGLMFQAKAKKKAEEADKAE